VDNDGRLVGTTTGKDLGLFMKSPTIQALQDQIFNFLKAVRQEQIEIKSPCITINSDNTLHHAIGLLAATKVHRIFIIDDNITFTPVAVLTITDILQSLVKQTK